MSSPLLKFILIVGVLLPAALRAEEPGNEPKAIPQTRAEEKQALEALKHRKPRLPLPEPTAEEKERAATGGLGLVNNGRMRAHYLPEELRPRSNNPPRPAGSTQGAGGLGGGRPSDPKMTLNYPFTVELFWIASRVNNCHYCLGHQEVKLQSEGLSDDRVALLDTNWAVFSPAEQAAYALARKLTLEPHLLTNDDFIEVKKHYTPLQVLEIVFHVSRYNATNRWTDSLGIPQEDHRNLLTETNQAFANQPSIVAPSSIPERDVPPSRSEALKQIVNCRTREARLPVVDEAEARKVLGDPAFAGRVPQWARLLVNFPVSGKSAVETQLLLMEKGALPRELKAEINFVAARQDRAWYALGTVMQQLAELGYSEDQMFALDNPSEHHDPARGAALAFAAKLSATPQAIADVDIENLRKHFSDSEVAEIVYRTTQAAFFDRLTEAAALPLDDLQ